VASTTTRTSLPKPDSTDAPFVHLDMSALADALDTRIQVVCTSASRPAHTAGQRIYETDTKQSYVSDGTAWLLESGGQRSWSTDRGASPVTNTYASGSMISLVSGTTTLPAGDYDVVAQLHLAGSAAVTGNMRVVLNSVNISSDPRCDVQTFPILQTYHFRWVWTGGSCAWALSHQLASGTGTVYNLSTKTQFNWLGRV
jgi:hypothetical protein